MNKNILSLIEESRSLNPKLFSLTRIQLLSSLADLGKDGASYRELKLVLGLEDGALHSNLTALIEMGYLESKKVEVEDKELTSYNITPEGEIAWNRVKEWLKKIINC